ncbi:MAG TPA: hypothetical protein VEO54_29400 [Thermoanaerobaculia bacterium]|nr:hypothetical protein [Thermoanaerobaculia bacterium]
MTPAIGLLLVLLAPPRTLLQASGGGSVWPVGIHGQAVGWYLPEPQHGVTVAARLGNGGGHAYLDAYLMRAIGPGTTEEDEIARTSLDLQYPHDGWVDLFSGLDLEPGLYWLIVGRPRERAHSSINWFVAQPGELVTGCGAQYAGSRSFTFHSDAAEYLPASKFAKKYEPYYFQFEVRVEGEDGCPPLPGDQGVVTVTSSMYSLLP